MVVMPRASESFGRAQAYRLALPEDLPGVLLPQARDGLDEARLARPVVTDQGGDLALQDFEVDAVDRLDGAEALLDPPQLDERRAVRLGTLGTHYAPSSLVLGSTAPPPAGAGGGDTAWIERLTSRRPYELLMELYPLRCNRRRMNRRRVGRRGRSCPRSRSSSCSWWSPTPGSVADEVTFLPRGGVDRRPVDQAGRWLLPCPQVDGDGGCRRCLNEDGLVHGPALVARQDVVEAGRRGVLPGGREGLGRHVLRLQVRDDRRPGLVVGDQRPR